MLSKDTGFDTLIKHLQTLGRNCRRVANLKDALPPAVVTAKAAAAPVDPYQRLLTLLRKERLLPSKRKGLAGKVRSWFAKLSDAERDALLERLFRESKVIESGPSLGYQL